MNSDRAPARAILVAAACLAAPACGMDLYGNVRYRSLMLELPGAGGDTREVPGVRAMGDFSAAREGFWSLDMRTLRYQWAAVGAWSGAPYESWPETRNVKLAEATLDIDVSPAWFLEAGKKRLKIGSGYFRRPSDIFSPDPGALKHRVGDDLDRTREGLIGAGALHYASWGSLSFFASPRLAWGDSTALARYALSPQDLWQGFLRGASKLGGTDLDLTLQVSADSARDVRSAVGVNVVTLAAENTELHLDALLQDRESGLPDPGPGEEEVQAWREPSLTSLIGVSHSFDAHWGLIVEYLFNGGGLYHDDYFRALRRLGDLASQGRFAEAQALRDVHGPLSLSRHYAMLRAAYAEGDQFLAELLGIGNLQDGGGYLGLRMGFTPAGWIRVRGEVGTNFGGKDTEGGGLAETWHTEFGLEFFL